VLSPPIAPERLQPVGGRNPEILQILGGIQHGELSQSYRDDRNKPARFARFPELAGFPTPEAFDHSAHCIEWRYGSQAVSALPRIDKAGTEEMKIRRPFDDQDENLGYESSDANTERDTVIPLVEQAMRKALLLQVPVVVETGTSKN
jgi:hypothetical protein